MISVSGAGVAISAKHIFSSKGRVQLHGGAANWWSCCFRVGLVEPEPSQRPKASFNTSGCGREGGGRGGPIGGGRGGPGGGGLDPVAEENQQGRHTMVSCVWPVNGPCCKKLYFFLIYWYVTLLRILEKSIKQQRSTLSRTPQRVTLYLYDKLLLRHIRQERSFQGADQY
jgi:hypothetical protein